MEDRSYDGLQKLARDMRVIPLIVGISTLLIANRLWIINRENSDVSFLSDFWAYWLLGAGLLSILFAIFTRSKWLMAVSGSVIIVGYLGRAIIVLFGIFDGDLEPDVVRANIQGILYTLTAILVFIIWFRLIRPANNLLRRGR